MGWKSVAALVVAMIMVGSGSSFAIAWFIERQQPASGGAATVPQADSATDVPAPAPQAGGPSATGDAVEGPLALNSPAPFDEAVQVAEEAVVAGGQAQTPPEWSQVAELWQRASALMAAVPEVDPRFDTARDRVVEYRSNSEYARQRALSLQLENSR